MRTELRLRDQQRARADLPRPKASALIAQHSVLCFALGALLFALCAIAEAQQQGKIPRIGYLSSTSLSAEASRLDGLREGLRDLGYVEGKNIVIEYRFVEGKFDRLPDL